MSDKTDIEVGSTVKIEKRANGWVATVVGPNNGSHSGKPFHPHVTFEEAVAYIKEAFDVA